ncbi:unnamed protein product [Acanthoscelides obtectus]|uniref:Uncharacterized protein n=1 Tax=Acanthoscelides obtectus TaxID=200917 RepID=A0A9P0JP05_ACAOB|nr:unnamed protein product [Acanthoscelides obtectus]CAK1642782.1 hypothetical protein AOBTE_LOCUS13210 [Acanthoscelides obtectus]
MQKLAKESKMDNFLFGKTFMEKCKINQTINKSAVELQVSKVPASSQIFNRSHLNWQRPKTSVRFRKSQFLLNKRREPRIQERNRNQWRSSRGNLARYNYRNRQIQ